MMTKGEEGEEGLLKEDSSRDSNKKEKLGI